MNHIFAIGGLEIKVHLTSGVSPLQCFPTDSAPGPAETWVVPLDKARIRTAETAQKKLGEIDEMNYCILG